MDGEKFMKMTTVEIKETPEYDLLLRQSRLLFPDVENWLLEVATAAYFKNGCKDDYTQIDPVEVQKIRDTYNTDLVVETPTS